MPWSFNYLLDSLFIHEMPPNLTSRGSFAKLTPKMENIPV